MNPRKHPTLHAQPMCGELHPDDGADPRELFQSVRNKRGDHRKSWQLCRQVADTLNQVLGGECDDETLRDLLVVSVAPAPDTSQLLVLVAPALPGDVLDAQLVQDRLAAASGRLRSEVAAAITRRRTPKLVFQFIAATNDEVLRR